MKTPAQILSGHAFLGEELEESPVDIHIENGIITAIEENRKAPRQWIFPALFNAHTHLGDTIAMDCGVTGDLVTLVTPPHGLKHKLLAQAGRTDLVAGMRASMECMIAGGTHGCADFREGGTAGVTALLEAGRDLPFCPLVFGREGGETIADGLGISSTRDVKGTDRLVTAAKKAGKKIAFHAGERDSLDVDAALAYDPDLIIHATHATRKQLRYCAEAEIPIVVCPRSNWTLGVAASDKHPPLSLMGELGCRVYFGTDNVMFVPPDLLSELAFTATVYKQHPKSLLHAAVAGSALTGSPFFIRMGAWANLFTIDPARSGLRFSHDPVASLVKRGYNSPIRNNVFNL
ncbi:MAG: amidohydrolase family protein [Methanomicrobiales archaeon]|nr:amidohydrolase family protein [Methanomicrobiales archaeon]